MPAIDPSLLLTMINLDGHISGIMGHAKNISKASSEHVCGGVSRKSAMWITQARREDTTACRQHCTLGWGLRQYKPGRKKPTDSL